MAAWAAKRFWKQATVTPCDGGFTVLLDGRAVKTPAKTPLVVPTEALALAIAAEWDAQTGVVNPDSMPTTRMANSALDKVAPQFAEVAEMLASYGGTDLLCYRAEAPRELVARQAAAWDPLIDWLAETQGAPLQATAGVMFIPQPEPSLARLSACVHALTSFELAAFHDLVAISGSLVLALALIDGRLDPETAWSLSRLDEAWQIEQWGEDESAAESEAARHDAFAHAARFFGLCR